MNANERESEDMQTIPYLISVYSCAFAVKKSLDII